MTYSLVHANTPLDDSGTKVFPPVSASLVSTAAGNLLVAVAMMDGGVGVTSFTVPSGWSQAYAAVTTTAGVAIFYLPNCSAGITSVSITNNAPASNSYFWAQAFEFHDSAGSNATPLDVTGSASGTTSPQAIATGSAAQAHDLAVSILLGAYGSGTKDTLSTGTGFTQGGTGGQGTKQTEHVISDYLLDTGASSGTVTDSVSFTGPFTYSRSAIATFKIASAAPAGLLPQQERQRLSFAPPPYGQVRRRSLATYGR
jgi:hypothetical protein